MHLGDAVVEHALAVDDGFLLGIEGGCIVLVVNDQGSGLRPFTAEDLGLALINAGAPGVHIHNPHPENPCYPRKLRPQGDLTPPISRGYREVAGGWGNQMWRLGDELAVRVQRMDPTPSTSSRSGGGCPCWPRGCRSRCRSPCGPGEPSERFPKHWTVMTWVPGEPLDHGSISHGTHAADTLAGFLRALHVEAPAEAPVAADRGTHPRTVRTVSRTSSRPWPPTTSRPMSGMSGTTRSRPPHGRARPCGCTATCTPRTSSSRAVRSRASSTSVTCSPGDPAWDLAAAWVLLPAGAASRFFDVYAHADEAAIRRPAGWPL